MDLAFYESPEYYDRLDRARGEASSRPLALLESGGSLVPNGITLLAMAAITPLWRLVACGAVAEYIASVLCRATLQLAFPPVVGADNCRQALDAIL